MQPCAVTCSDGLVHCDVELLAEEGVVTVGESLLPATPAFSLLGIPFHTDYKDIQVMARINMKNSLPLSRFLCLRRGRLRLTRNNLIHYCTAYLFY